MNWASARSRRAPGPQRTAKRALAILTARARSSRPSASPSSSCGLGAKPNAGDGADTVVGIQLDDAHAPGVAALGADVGGMETDHLALGRDDQDVVAVAHLEHADDVAVAAAGLDVDDPLAAPALQPVLLERRALAEAALGHGEDRQALLDDVGGNHVVALLDLDALHAGRAAAHRPHFLLGEADDHAELRGDHDLTVAVGAPGGDDPVAVLEADRLDAARPWVRVRLELGLLHLALLRREEHGAARREVAHRHARGDRLALAEREDVDHRLPLRLPPAFRDLVHLEPVDLAERGEEQQKGVG